MPLRLAALGAIALVTGLVKLQLHMTSMANDPFLSAWCRTPGLESGSLISRSGEWLLFGHCWGCYVAAGGAAMLVYAIWQAVQRRQGIRTRG